MISAEIKKRKLIERQKKWDLTKKKSILKFQAKQREEAISWIKSGKASFGTVGRARLKTKTSHQLKSKLIKDTQVVFNEYIRSRDKYCLRCRNDTKLQCSHTISRGSNCNLKFVEENCITLCLKCHLYWWHREPKGAIDWFNSQKFSFGNGKDILERLSGVVSLSPDETDPILVLKKMKLKLKYPSVASQRIFKKYIIN
jgi:hypothetical protein